MTLGTALKAGYDISQLFGFLSNNYPNIGKKINEAKRLGYDVNQIIKYFSDLTPDQIENVENSSVLKGNNPWVNADEVHKKNSAYAQAKKHAPKIIGAVTMPLAAYTAYRALKPAIAPMIQSGLDYLQGNNQTESSSMPKEPTQDLSTPTSLQPGDNLGQQIGQQIKEPVSPDQINQAAKAIPAQQPQSIFKQLMTGVDISKLQPDQVEQLKFLNTVSDQLQSKGKGINDPEVQSLAKKVQDTVKGKATLAEQEISKFNQAYPQDKNKPEIQPESIKEGKPNVINQNKGLDPSEAQKLLDKMTSFDEPIYDKHFGKGFYRNTLLKMSEKEREQWLNENSDKFTPEDIKKLQQLYKSWNPDHTIESLQNMIGNKKSVELPKNVIEPQKIDKPKSISKGETVVTEDGNVAEIKGISGNNFLIEENGKVRQVPMDSLRAQPEAIKKAKIVFDHSKIPEEDKSAALSISIPMPDRSGIINMFHDGTFYLYKRKDGKPLDESIIQRVIEGQDIPISSGETFMGAWNNEKGDSRGSAAYKELTAMAQSLEDMKKQDNPNMPLTFEKITNSYTHGYLKEFMKLLKEAGKQFSAKPKKTKK